MSINTKLTYADYAMIPADGLHHEIIDGEHHVNPGPNLYHQHVSRHLQHPLFTAVELKGLGVVINAPVDLQLSPHDIVQPDLVVITVARKSIMTPTKIKGVPDLVVEILSPSSSKHDTERKRGLNERFGTPEYWIVDPDEHSVLQLVLDRGVYREAICTNAIKMANPPHVEVDLGRVW